jgi:hypothetical protein
MITIYTLSVALLTELDIRNTANRTQITYKLPVNIYCTLYHTANIEQKGPDLFKITTDDNEKISDQNLIRNTRLCAIF